MAGAHARAHERASWLKADIPYDKLLDMDQINGDFPSRLGTCALVSWRSDVDQSRRARNDAVEPDLRYADPRCRQVPHRHGDQAADESWALQGSITRFYYLDQHA